jgi:hypothetical protein
MSPLSRPDTEITFGDIRVYGRSAEVSVCATEPVSTDASNTGSEGSKEPTRHYYVVKLSQQAQGLWKGCWLTDGVRPAPVWDTHVVPVGG